MRGGAGEEEAGSEGVVVGEIKKGEGRVGSSDGDCEEG